MYLKDKIIRTVSAMPPPRKKLFGLCLAVFLVGIFLLLWRANQSWLVSVPTSGSQYVEGLVSTPRFINPLLASTAVERDLTTLVYSGLLRSNETGEFIPDLAESYTVSPDGLTYSFTLRPDLVWHDGEPVITDDIIFTIAKAKDPAIRSPRRASWEGVEVEKIDNRHLVFKLKQPYALFLENLTLGILPAHRWQKITTAGFSSTNLNLEPVGTGPYQISNIKRDSDNLPLIYTLTPFSHFTLGEPKIAEVIIRFYPNEEALLSAYNRGEIDAINAVDPLTARILEKNGARVLATTLPRVFGIFFNQNQQKLFTRPEVRAALDAAVDRQTLVTEVFSNYAKPLTGPLPLTLFSELTNNQATTSPNEILKRAGWQKNSNSGKWELPSKKKGEESLALRFTLTTSDTPELKRVAELVKQNWEALGVTVDLKIFELGALNEVVIRPRDYEALLFGEIVGRNPDLYSFWHSAQRLDPGLNIALYTNTTVDKILDELKVASTTDRRASAYQAFDTEIRQDKPAVFLYAPDFLYLVPRQVEGINLGIINTPAERFLSIYKWYIKTDRVWPIFVNN
ncbi:MAG: peptide ABC transporter substrate-binding protein [Candidatus Vogelbacteria bacterium]